LNGFSTNEASIALASCFVKVVLVVKNPLVAGMGLCYTYFAAQQAAFACADTILHLMFWRIRVD